MPGNASVETWIIHTAIHVADGRTSRLFATFGATGGFRRPADPSINA